MIRVGPAGWSYKDWDGIVYPTPKPRGFKPLAMIARLFDLAEVNVTFYSPPRPEIAEEWCRVLDRLGAERFRFFVKLWQGFTHDPQLPDHGEPERLREICDVLQGAGRLAAVLAQFPWSFKNTAISRQRLFHVTKEWEAFPLAIEMRHGTWDHEEYRAWLQERGYAHVNIDQPVIGESLGPSAHITNQRLAYVRLHGRNDKAWFAEKAGRDERYNYLYTAEELAPWAVRIGQISNEARETLIVTNNHFRGQAITNALELQAAIDPQREVPVPSTLVDAYPELRNVPGLHLGTSEELYAVPAPPAEEMFPGQTELF